MSPRGFKLGLVIFIVMSGLFGAKLAMTGSGSLVSSWRNLTAQLSAGSGQSAAASSTPAGEPAAKAVAPPPVLVKNQDIAAALDAESAAHTAPPLSESDKALVAAIKVELKARGYETGSASAALDLQSRAAIIAFEADNDLRLTGEASEPLLHRLLLGAVSTQANSSTPPAPRAEEVIRSVQAALKAAGHPDLKVDGRMSTETVETIRAFERQHNLKVTGRISGDLVGRLKPVARDAAAASH
jgi:hypothetical protein